MHGAIECNGRQCGGRPKHLGIQLGDRGLPGECCWISESAICLHALKADGLAQVRMSISLTPGRADALRSHAPRTAHLVQYRGISASAVHFHCRIVVIPCDEVFVSILSRKYLMRSGNNGHGGHQQCIWQNAAGSRVVATPCRCPATCAG